MSLYHLWAFTYFFWECSFWSCYKSFDTNMTFSLQLLLLFSFCLVFSAVKISPRFLYCYYALYLVLFESVNWSLWFNLKNSQSLSLEILCLPYAFSTLPMITNIQYQTFLLNPMCLTLYIPSLLLFVLWSEYRCSLTYNEVIFQ